jgi:hypothetical protein
MGMSAEEYAAGGPPLTRENDQVVRAWHFCGGWKPELIGYAAAYLGVRDIEFLTRQLLELRGVFDRQAKEERDERAAGQE